MSETEPIRPPEGMARQVGAVAWARHLMRQSATVAEKLRALDEAAGARPALMPDLHRGLTPAAEGDVMLDDDLLLLVTWLFHRAERPAHRDYYLHAFPSPDRRAEVRQALGIPPYSLAREAVILLTVDCCRGDRMGCNGCPRPLTPNIDRLAAEGANFPRAYSTAGQTAQSFPAILLSTFFQDFGQARVVPEQATTLAEVMSRSGYSTAAVNAANPHVSHFYGYDRGFDEFHDFLRQANFNHLDETFSDDSPKRKRAPTEAEMARVFQDFQAHPDIHDILREVTKQEGVKLMSTIAKRERFYPYTAGDVVRCALTSLHDPQAGERRFLWLHLMDLHENITVPWSPSGAFSIVQRYLLNWLLESSAGMDALRPFADKYRELYDSAVAYVDANVGILRNFLEDAGLLERSLFVVTADHGQELLEHGVFGHGYDRLREGVIHVPLVFGGGMAQPLAREATDRPVSTLDLAPTVLDLCGVEDKPAGWLGTTLNDARPRPVHGQTFYDGADNRCTGKGRRAFELKPFPAPVRECCKQMFYRIEGGYQVLHDDRTGRTEVNRLLSAREPGLPPDPDQAREQARRYLDSVYSPPEEPVAFTLAADDMTTVSLRLKDLGYL